jgi:hypothetical protein
MKRIFISHISDEAPLAIGIKKLLEKVYFWGCKVFVSSDPSDLSGGEQWMKTLEQELSNSDLLIVICSPRSLTRQWISVETGCAWTRGKPIIPICHSGLTKIKLPSPFSAFQGFDLDLSSTKFLLNLLKSIEKILSDDSANNPFLNKEHDLEELKQSVEDIRSSVVELGYYDFFISSPISAFDDEESYQAFRGEIILPAVDMLCKQIKNCKFYCVAYHKSSFKSLDLKHESSKQDLAALRSSKTLIFIYPKYAASSCLVEVGYALALNTPSLYLAPSNVKLPFILAKADKVYNVVDYQYEDAADLLNTLSKHYMSYK